MTKLTAIGNLSTQIWDLLVQESNSYYLDVYFNFFGNSEFRDLLFGIDIIHDNHTVFSKSWPQTNKKYIRLTQNYLENERIKLVPNVEYNLIVWASNDSTRFESQQMLKMPIPKKPYESWIWQDHKWNAPRPYPQDGKSYKWEELLEQWTRTSET